MPSIYSRLPGCDREDFVTEVLAGVLLRCPTVASRLVERMTGLLAVVRVTSVQTQASYKEGRPDLELHVLLEGGERRRVLVENKVDACEGENQLCSYAAILKRMISTGHAAAGHLVYLTRDSDHKEEGEILAGCACSQVYFQQLRWLDVHHMLQEIGEELPDEERPWAAELARFLEEQGMVPPTTFTPDDLVAMGALQRLIALLEECLDGEHWDFFVKLAGDQKLTPQWVEQVRNCNRYIYYRDQDNWFWIGIGFWLDGPFPKVGLNVEVDPKHSQQQEIVAAFKDLDGFENRWALYHTTEGWDGAWARRPITDFFNSEDHVDAIKTWLKMCIEDLTGFKKRHPELPWLVPT